MTAAIHWLAALFVLLATAPLAAETTLRWKLPPGERLSLTVEQQTTSAVTAVGRTTTTQIDLTMTLDWHVTAATDEQITLRQALRRVRFRMDSPNVGRVTYDSADRSRPIGQAREVAAAIAPLLEGEVEIVMSPRGNVLEARPIGEAAQRLAAGEGDAAAPLSRQRIEQLLRQPLALLPEGPVNAGDTWQRETELTTPLGPAQQTTTYKYLGPPEEQPAGGDVHVIETHSQLLPPMPAAGAPKLTLKSHEQAGTVRFSPALGRPVSAEQTQTLVTERPYRDTTIGVRLTSKQTTTVRSAGHEADDQPAAP
jgi:hypothetical protein